MTSIAGPGYFPHPVGKTQHTIAGNRHDYHDKELPFTVRTLCGVEVEMTSHEKPDDTAFFVASTCLDCEAGAKQIQERNLGGLRIWPAPTHDRTRP